MTIRTLVKETVLQDVLPFLGASTTLAEATSSLQVLGVYSSILFAVRRLAIDVFYRYTDLISSDTMASRIGQPFENASVAESVQRIARDMGVQRELNVVHSPSVTMQIGANIALSRPVLALQENEVVDDSGGLLPEAEFLIAHECAHIRGNHSWAHLGRDCLLNGIVLTTHLFKFKLIPCLLAFFVTKSLCHWAWTYVEKSADLAAVRHLGNADAAVNYFMQEKHDNLAYRNAQNLSLVTRLWRQLLITSDGNIRFLDPHHPSCTDRIAYLEEEQRALQS